MRAFERLTSAWEREDVSGVLAILADQPLDQKRAEVYPPLVAFVADQLCAPTRTKLPANLVGALTFLRREVALEPAIAAQLYAAIGGRTVRHEASALFQFIAHARDRAGAALLRGGATTPHWVDAVIAIGADALLDEILAALAASPSRDLATAAGVVGGARARAALRAGPGGSTDVRPIGLAFVADPADKAYFGALGRTPNETTAKRIYALRAARGPKQRLDALADLAPGLLGGTEASCERLVATLLALGDPRPDIVESAAVTLAASVRGKAAATRARSLFIPMFRTHAYAAVARGVTELARTALEQIRAAIRHAPPFPDSAPLAKPPTRKAVAKAKAAAMLETIAAPAAFTTRDQREPGIEAQIAANPDDAAGYLVYADWLQTVGDPRGTWITLHTARRGAGTQEAIAAFLREHRDAILGPFAAFIDAPGVAVDWHLGFIRRAQLDGVAAARALLEAPCGAFVRELAFPECEPSEIEALVLARRPATLERIATGVEDLVTPALVAAVPRLERDVAAHWRAVVERIDDERKLGLEVDVPLPALAAVEPGLELDRDTLLKGLKHELGLGKSLGVVAALRRVATATSRDAFARALGEAWYMRQGDSMRWVFAAMGALGGDETARVLGGQLHRLHSRERVLDAVRYLGQIGTDAAVDELTRLAFDLEVAARLRKHACSVLEAVAQDRDETLDEIAARAITPRVRQRWLTSLMVDGRTLPRDAFAALSRDGSWCEVAARLLWCERDPAGAIAGLFRVTASGAPVRRDGSPYHVQQGVGLPHPAELTVTELAGARRAFADIDQPILQLERPVFELSERDAQRDDLDRFVRRRVGFAPIQTTLQARGWYVRDSDVYDDDGESRWAGTRAFARDFGRDGFSIIATLNDTRGSIASVQAVRSAPQPFTDVHVVTISEALWDLETAHRRSDEPAIERAPPLERERAPMTAPASPFVVERAKSGRAKCVACGQPIAKDSWRIGIERDVETPSFRGRATVWCHPACRDQVGELAGVALPALDER